MCCWNSCSRTGVMSPTEGSVSDVGRVITARQLRAACVRKPPRRRAHGVRKGAAAPWGFERGRTGRMNAKRCSDLRAAADERAVDCVERDQPSTDRRRQRKVCDTETDVT